MYQDHGGGVGSPQHSPAMRKQDYVTLAVHTCLLVLTLGLALGVHQYAVHERDLEVHDATADRNLALMKMRTDAEESPQIYPSPRACRCTSSHSRRSVTISTCRGNAPACRLRYSRPTRHTDRTAFVLTVLDW